MAKMNEQVIWVTDTETTGDKPPEAAICELAAVPVTRSGKVLLSGALTTLVNPGHPIPPEVRGIHHISDKDVAKAPKIEAVIRKGAFKSMFDGSPVAAHNMEYDIQYLRGYIPEDAPLICTYRAARHMYPDAPNYKNQTLRYYLDVDPPASALKGMAPHRALYDTICTAFILARMLREATIEQLVAYRTTPVLLKTVPFGSHFGQPWKEVPAKYLDWILGKDFDMDVKHTAWHWREVYRGKRAA